MLPGEHIDNTLTADAGFHISIRGKGDPATRQIQGGPVIEGDIGGRPSPLAGMVLIPSPPASHTGQALGWA
ncbi:hypothetical protein DSCO28_41080 [Desulfosarcina ovata subsp. sediminis]|uniref:Uncharacterized protein n=1 Tax=Desulfosarcina ovata subsp. sediminis TaxID=885957 RepID=A0A5K7ZTL7_9BACT|nr:hypothetical protein [Desulfosarcina ovata]BBO83542.1 hypothetical protein DSCO28_41080 [Desulfosarcina ovata subsp. sediminis]